MEQHGTLRLCCHPGFYAEPSCLFFFLYFAAALSPFFRQSRSNDDGDLLRTKGKTRKANRMQTRAFASLNVQSYLTALRFLSPSCFLQRVLLTFFVPYVRFQPCIPSLYLYLYVLISSLRFSQMPRHGSSLSDSTGGMRMRGECGFRLVGGWLDVILLYASLQRQWKLCDRWNHTGCVHSRPNEATKYADLSLV